MNAADLAMQVALPEFDGRLSGFPISFKEDGPELDGFSERRAVPFPAGIAALADRASAWVALKHRPRAGRRLALVLSDYPARGGRAGFAVGLDTPASAGTIAETLRHAGYAVGHLPEPDALMHALTKGGSDLRGAARGLSRLALHTIAGPARHARSTVGRTGGRPGLHRRGVPIPDGRGHYCFPPTTSS